MSKTRQMYEIYINDRLLVLLSEAELSNYQTDSSTLVMPYMGIKKNLFQFMDILEKSSRFSNVVLFTKELEQLYEDVCSLLLIIPAGGGIIKNLDHKLLMIFRKGFWDLPKGKLDLQEKFKDAALRECQEETGLQNLSLDGKFETTLHFFCFFSYTRCLKKTKWYLMSYQGVAPPIPQIEEDIEGIGWFGLQDALQLRPMHLSILKLLQSYQAKSLI